jgi:putative membrane protein
MIRNFSDHAANERTFLAWVRTAIAVMAFGFLIEKFDLFLKYAGLSSGLQVPPQLHQRAAAIAGLALIVLGALLLGVATHRFLRTARDIDSDEVKPGTGSKLDVALATLLFVLGCALSVYLAQNLIATF